MDPDDLANVLATIMTPAELRDLSAITDEEWEALEWLIASAPSTPPAASAPGAD